MAYMHSDKSKRLCEPGHAPTLSSVGLYEIDYVLCDSCGEQHREKPDFSWTPVWDTDTAYAHRRESAEKYHIEIVPREVCRDCGAKC